MRERSSQRSVESSMPRRFVLIGSALLLLAGAPSTARADEPKPPKEEPVKAPEPVKPPEVVKPPEPVRPVKPPEPVKPTSKAAPPEAAKAPEKVLEPEQVRGMFRGPVQPGRVWGDFVAALLFIPRKTVELIFLASGTAAGLVRDEQVVPRVEELLAPRSGEITLFPTLFLATRQHPSAGVRVLARRDPFATSVAFGIGGPYDYNGEARVRFAISHPLPFAIDVEGLYDSRSGLSYLGLGQDPARDCRNRYVGTTTDPECVGEVRFRSAGSEPTALYLETRSRGIVSLGVRPGANFELFASSSFTNSHVTESPGSPLVALSSVFQPGNVVAASGSTHQFYTEFAVRYDTRLTSGRPSAGALLEGYTGLARGTGDDPSGFLRAGGRAALFLPILRPYNILSPRLTIDGLAPALDPRVPFTDLVSQPDFRGFDSRRDYFSAVVSLDYRWSLMRYLAARIFVDSASVAPSPARIFEAPPRVAAGFGIDLFSDSALLGQLAFSFSGDGVRLLLSFGLPAGFGDRQHRY
jgi:hypothetical protein